MHLLISALEASTSIPLRGRYTEVVLISAMLLKLGRALQTSAECARHVLHS